MDEKIFNDTMQGLSEALAYTQGDKTKGRSRFVSVPDILPLKEYSNEEIRQIRIEKQMTQKTFADVLGVSVKSVEAWEAGTNKPNGSAVRLLQLIEKEESVLQYMLVK